MNFVIAATLECGMRREGEKGGGGIAVAAKVGSCIYTTRSCVHIYIYCRIIFLILRRALIVNIDGGF